MNEYLNREYKFSCLKIKDDTEIDLIINRPETERVLIEIKSKTNHHQSSFLRTEDGIHNQTN